MEKQAKKTRILAISDVHGDTGLVKRLAERAKKEDVDLVILAGDLVASEKETKNLVGPFIKAKKQVLLLHGNHESIATIDFISNLYPNTKNIHGYSVIHGDVGIFGAGGADFGMNPMSEAEFTKTIGKSHSYLKNVKKKILVTHMHPADTGAEFSGIEGSKSIRKAIEKYKPDLAIFGHIHEAGGLQETIGKTRIISVSRNPTIIEL